MLRFIKEKGSMVNLIYFEPLICVITGGGNVFILPDGTKSLDSGDLIAAVKEFRR